jgi:hypothetical protein
VTTNSAWLPPEYVNLPTAIAYACEVDDAVLVTMGRILGLCWQYNYERSPALAPGQVAELTGRSRSALYRHLKLLQEMKWLRVDAGRVKTRPALCKPSTPRSVTPAGSRPARL